MPPVLSKLGLKGHEASRLTCCAICVCEKGNKASRPISEKDADLIRQKVSEHFSLEDLRFAKALCTTCHLNLQKLKKGQIKQLYLSSKFGEKVRRSKDGCCQCTLCYRAALTGAGWLVFRKKYSDKFKLNQPSGRAPGRAPGSARAPGVAKRRAGGCPGPAPGHVGHAADAVHAPGHVDDAGNAPGHADVTCLAPGHADVTCDAPGHAGPDPPAPAGRRGWSGPGKPNRLCPNCLTEVRLTKLWLSDQI